MISDAPEFSDPVQDDVEVSLLLENFDIPDMKIILEHDNTISGINSIDRKQLQNCRPQVLSSMSSYYVEHFPYKLIYRWLSNYSDKLCMKNREFSFTLTNDVYVRYLSFETPEAFLYRLKKDPPAKIDIGAVYNIRPEDRKSISAIQSFIPIERELVFDIDMSDYNDIRTCCQDKSVCPKCWKFLAVAVKIIDAALRDDFGFENILWVFSGRRGVHCWVSDSRAKKLSAQARKAIVSFLEISRSNVLLQLFKSSTSMNKLHPSVQRSLNIIDQYFHEIINDQNLFTTPESQDIILKMISKEEHRNWLQKSWSNCISNEHPSSSKYWEIFSTFVNEIIDHSTSEAQKLSFVQERIKIYMLYPRLDSNVSIQLNHLLKSPFCVHPSTGKICVPLDPQTVDEFDPSTALNLDDLNNGNNGLSLFKVFLNDFEAFIKKCEDSQKRDSNMLKDLRESTLDF